MSVATFTPGGSYGGGATTRVWSWDGATWTQLGADMPATADPVIAARRGTVYLALQDAATGALMVMRWTDGGWAPLPSPGLGRAPALAFTSSGDAVVAFVDTASPSAIHVAVLDGGEWRQVGDQVATVGDGLANLALALDEQDRPTLAWSEFGTGQIFVKRYRAALP
jgi:hypothetical protein